MRFLMLSCPTDFIDVRLQPLRLLLVCRPNDPALPIQQRVLPRPVITHARSAGLAVLTPSLSQPLQTSELATQHLVHRLGTVHVPPNATLRHPLRIRQAPPHVDAHRENVSKHSRRQPASLHGGGPHRLHVAHRRLPEGARHPAHVGQLDRSHGAAQHDADEVHVAKHLLVPGRRHLGLPPANAR
eukprot:7391951-Prymnesium_polylepis.1